MIVRKTFQKRTNKIYSKNQSRQEKKFLTAFCESKSIRESKIKPDTETNLSRTISSGRSQKVDQISLRRRAGDQRCVNKFGAEAVNGHIQNVVEFDLRTETKSFPETELTADI